MKKQLLFCLLFLGLWVGVHGQNVSSQRGNSAITSLDGQDIDNIATFFMGIETKKVLLGKDHALVDLIIEEYEDHKLKNTDKVISKSVQEAIKMFGRNPIKKDSKNQYVRVYFKNNIAEKKAPELYFAYLNFSAPYRFKGVNLKNAESYAFPNVPAIIKTRTPFAALCGTKKEVPIDTPPNATAADLATQYDWVAILYLEPLDEK